MQKYITQWIHHFSDETIEFIKNEEHIQHLQVKFFSERWRTKEEYIALLEETIRILKTDF